MEAWSRFLDTFFNLDVIERYFPAIMKGVVVTIEIAAAVVVTGTLLGLVLAIVRTFRLIPMNALIVVFVDMFRALPPLVLVLLVYFGLPNIGINLPSFAVLWLVLALVLAAFAEEIFWAGILSIPKGQWEAARSTGLGFLGTLAYVVLPQAIRLTVPPLTNRTIAITKNTALGTVIGVGEILNQATTAQSFSGNATPLMMGAIAYVILFIPVVVLGRVLETRFAWRRVYWKRSSSSFSIWPSWSERCRSSSLAYSRRSLSVSSSFRLGWPVGLHARSCRFRACASRAGRRLPELISFVPFRRSFS